MKNKKECILYEGKLCDDCGECNMCDLDPKKVCDSCGKCIDSGDDYNIFDVDLIREDSDEPLNYIDEFENPEDEEYYDYDDFGLEDEADDGLDLDDEDFFDDEDSEEEDFSGRDFGEFFS